MPQTKAQSRQLIQELSAEMDALDTQITAAKMALLQAKSLMDELIKRREPLIEEQEVLKRRHARIHREDA